MPLTRHMPQWQCAAQRQLTQISASPLPLLGREICATQFICSGGGPTASITSMLGFIAASPSLRWKTTRANLVHMRQATENSNNKYYGNTHLHTHLYVCGQKLSYTLTVIFAFLPDFAHLCASKLFGILTAGGRKSAGVALACGACAHVDKIL